MNSIIQNILIHNKKIYTDFNYVYLEEKMRQTVRIAIIPAAGLGTRFLPATK